MLTCHIFADVERVEVDQGDPSLGYELPEVDCRSGLTDDRRQPFAAVLTCFPWRAQGDRTAPRSAADIWRRYGAGSVPMANPDAASVVPFKVTSTSSAPNGSSLPQTRIMPMG
jgi:hypothetical protein